jgi:hypothetical protein
LSIAFSELADDHVLQFTAREEAEISFPVLDRPDFGLIALTRLHSRWHGSDVCLVQWVAFVGQSAGAIHSVGFARHETTGAQVPAVG